MTDQVPSYSPGYQPDVFQRPSSEENLILIAKVSAAVMGISFLWGIGGVALYKYAQKPSLQTCSQLMMKSGGVVFFLAVFMLIGIYKIYAEDQEKQLGDRTLYSSTQYWNRSTGWPRDP